MKVVTTEDGVITSMENYTGCQGLAGHLIRRNLQHDSGRLDFLFKYKSEDDLIENVASVKA